MKATLAILLLGCVTLGCEQPAPTQTSAPTSARTAEPTATVAATASTAAAGPLAPHYGDLMSQVGQRFEMLGRAAKAGRWELADFELGELLEVFEDLPHAKPPEKTNDVDLRDVEKSFLDTHPPELEAAIEAKDHDALAKAFAHAAATCNGCHKSTGHGFIEIPEEPGASVPKMDPVPGG